jgi:hypothetical protein
MKGVSQMYLSFLATFELVSTFILILVLILLA